MCLNVAWFPFLPTFAAHRHLLQANRHLGACPGKPSWRKVQAYDRSCQGERHWDPNCRCLHTQDGMKRHWGPTAVFQKPQHNEFENNGMEMEAILLTQRTCTFYYRERISVSGAWRLVLQPGLCLSAQLQGVLRLQAKHWPLKWCLNWVHAVHGERVGWVSRACVIQA